MQKKEINVIDLIRNAGFRATKPRVALMTFLEKARLPLHIQEIADGLKGAVDPVTVYRMIDAFRGVGLVREVSLLGERPKYELTDPDDDHHHIVCTKCHRIEDFAICDAEYTAQKALKQSRQFATITGHSFDLYGLCKGCAK